MTLFDQLRAALRNPRLAVLFAGGIIVMILAACAAIGPVPEIVGAQARESMGLFDYKVFVDCTVRNTGKGGNIMVEAELNKGGFWKKEETIFLDAGNTRKVTFTFSEITFLGGGITSGNIRCGARPR
jgi:photosystem II stability/assembly factor-like uncharacterized protein